MDSSYLTGAYIQRFFAPNRASRACEASQLEAKMSDKENENNTDIYPTEVAIAVGAPLNI